MFTKAIVETYSDSCELVGLADPNRTRMNYTLSKCNLQDSGIPTYPATGFDRMIKETKPDYVVVTTVDQFHDQYIVRAMELGCDVITEKPMTTDAEKCQRILDTQKKTGRSVRVTFNYRYAPIRTVAREQIVKGAIGEVRSVDFNWMLDRRHGADYFRRWHRNKVNSGGLMVHKSTHHFDLVNWYIDSSPEVVFAVGSRGFYLPEQADQLGLQGRAERCHGCPCFEKCEFKIDLSKSKDRQNRYLNAEHEDGYYRDQCVFSDKIDIEDRVSVAARYQNGVTMSYSLNTWMPHEGYRLTINGTKGRLEMYVNESSYSSGDGTVQGELLGSSYLKIYPLFDEPYEPEIPEAKGGHGGGDAPLLEDIFSLDPPPDPMKRAASHIDGAHSILAGIAANKSMQTGQAVMVADLMKF